MHVIVVFAFLDLVAKDEGRVTAERSLVYVPLAPISGPYSCTRHLAVLTSQHEEAREEAVGHCRYPFLVAETCR